MVDTEVTALRQTITVMNYWICSVIFPASISSTVKRLLHRQVHLICRATSAFLPRCLEVELEGCSLVVTYSSPMELLSRTTNTVQRTGTLWSVVFAPEIPDLVDRMNVIDMLKLGLWRSPEESLISQQTSESGTTEPSNESQETTNTQYSPLPAYAGSGSTDWQEVGRPDPCMPRTPTPIPSLSQNGGTDINSKTPSYSMISTTPVAPGSGDSSKSGVIGSPLWRKKKVVQGKYVRLVSLSPPNTLSSNSLRMMRRGRPFAGGLS